MSFFMLKKGGVYQWTAPHLASGLRFVVVDIREVRLSYKFVRCYVIKYLNYNYKPAPLLLEITHSFVLRNAHVLSIISEPDNQGKANTPVLEDVGTRSRSVT